MKHRSLFFFLFSFVGSGFVNAADKSFTSPVLEAIEPSGSSAFALSLNNVTIDVLVASLLLCNTFGRLTLIGCLGYKAYKTALKALKDKDRRVKHGLRSLSYFSASCMLLSDGYQWVLNRDLSN